MREPPRVLEDLVAGGVVEAMVAALHRSTFIKVLALIIAEIFSDS